MQAELLRNLRHNFIVNLLDGGFFGAGFGFASYVTIIPLFISQLSDSATLIGLIPAIHVMGWQLPQLLMADRMARLSRFKPLTLLVTIHERLPFLGLAIVAWISPRLEPRLALALVFAMLAWQGFGAGFTATPWQSMIGKIIPPNRRGTFYGSQSAVVALAGGLSAVAAGLILQRVASPLDFTLCFIIACLFMVVSWFCLAETREPELILPEVHPTRRAFWDSLAGILRRDPNFRWFLLARLLAQIGAMAFAFYTVYVVRSFHSNEAAVGLMTGVLMGIQIIANPLMGSAGDRYGHKVVLELGVWAAVASAALAWWAPSVGWFFLVFILNGIANVAAWTTPMAMVLEFGSEADRPAYIGLANTLIAPVSFLAPLLGGWLADRAGFRAAFLVSAVAGLATALVVRWAVRNPERGEV